MLNTENKHIEVPAHIATNWDSVVLLSLFPVTEKAISAVIEITDKVINESAMFAGSRNKCRAKFERHSVVHALFRDGAVEAADNA